MSVWWDDRAEKERSTLVYKVFYVWLWPIERWALFHCMSSERAHWFGIHVAMPTVALIDVIWRGLVLAGVVPLLLLMRLWCWSRGGLPSDGDDDAAGAKERTNDGQK
jgi:hypothetical protein